MHVPKHYEKVNRGFWGILDSQLPAGVEAILPAASDRYYESVHFAELALTLLPTGEETRYINWYFSAHAGAYIGIFDAAQYDIKRTHPHVKF